MGKNNFGLIRGHYAINITISISLSKALVISTHFHMTMMEYYCCLDDFDEETHQIDLWYMYRTLSLTVATYYKTTFQTVNSLDNISMNGPDTLSLNESLVIAKAWKDAKDRRRANDSVNIAEVLSL